jgi:hypothetical protein
MMNLWRIALSFSLNFLQVYGVAQNVVIEGTLQSYEGQKIRILKRAQKMLSLKGPYQVQRLLSFSLEMWPKPKQMH